MLRDVQARLSAALSGDADPAEYDTLPDGWQVYRSSVIGAHVGALRECFPVCVRLVGDAFFDAAARKFSAGHPSMSADLNEYGEAFPGWLGDFPPAQELAYLSDVARFEWSWHRLAYTAPDAPVDPSRLAALPPEAHATLCLTPSRASVRFASPYAIDAIWRANQPAADGEEIVDLDSGGVHLWLGRGPNGRELHRMDADEWDFLERVDDGATLADLAEAGVDVVTLLPRAFERGWVAGWRRGSPTAAID